MAEQEPKKRRIHVGWIVAALVILLVLAVGAVSGLTAMRYREAIELAENGAFHQAQETLFLPAVFDKLEPQLSPYLRAGVLYEDGQFPEAAEAFSALGDYRDSQSTALEAQYYYAERLTEESRLEEAIALYRELAEMDYRDTADKYDTVRLKEVSKRFFEEASYKDCLQDIKLLISEDVPGADALLADMQETVYTDAIERYRAGKSREAEDLFALVVGYGETAKYRELCHIKMLREGDPPKQFAIKQEELMELVEFEDGAEAVLLTQRYAQVFLKGDWKAQNGGYYFNMKEDLSLSYSLPRISYGDYYYIEDGSIWMGVSTNRWKEPRIEFSMAVVDANCVDFFCWQDGSTHRLYRQ